MPYIDVNLTSKLSEVQKDAMKSKFGELITLLPGKTEAVLMVCINDGSTIYFSGEKKDKAAFVNIKLFKESGFEYKAELTAKIFEFFEKDFGVPGKDLFLSFDEYSSWGARGTLMK